MPATIAVVNPASRIPSPKPSRAAIRSVKWAGASSQPSRSAMACLDARVRRPERRVLREQPLRPALVAGLRDRLVVGGGAGAERQGRWARGERGRGFGHLTRMVVATSSAVALNDAGALPTALRAHAPAVRSLAVLAGAFPATPARDEHVDVGSERGGCQPPVAASTTRPPPARRPRATAGRRAGRRSAGRRATSRRGRRPPASRSGCGRRCTCRRTRPRCSRRGGSPAGASPGRRSRRRRRRGTSAAAATGRRPRARAAPTARRPGPAAAGRSSRASRTSPSPAVPAPAISRRSQP